MSLADFLVLRFGEAGSSEEKAGPVTAMDVLHHLNETYGNSSRGLSHQTSRTEASRLVERPPACTYLAGAVSPVF